MVHGRTEPRDHGRRLLLLVAFSVAATVFAIADAADGRIKRQLPPIEQGNQVIDDIFQIPISTLNAVGSLIKSTRPLVRRTRERIQQLYYSTGPQRPSASQQPLQQSYSSYGVRPFPMSSTQFGGVRPFYNGAYFGGANGNRIRRQRDGPLPQGRAREAY